MNFQTAALNIFIVFVSLFFVQCTERIDLGTELNQEELFGLQTTDTFNLIARTVLSDSLRTFSENDKEETFLVGILEDPITGRTEARFNVQMGVTEFQADTTPALFSQAFLDSIVLYMSWDEDAFYGDLGLGIGYEVRILDENYDFSQDYYADYNSAVRPMPLATTLLNTPMPDRGVPVPRTFIQNTSETTVVVDTVTNTLPIRLDNSFGQMILNADTSVFENSETFRDFLPGIQVSATSNSNGMVGIAGNAGISIRLFYSYVDASNVVRSSVYIMSNDVNCSDSRGFKTSCVRFTEISHDYTGSVVQEAIADPTFGDSLLVLQGLIGTRVEIEMPDLNLPQGVGINLATLRIPVDQNLQGDEDDFEPVGFVVASYEEGEDLIVIRDIGSSVYNGTIREDDDSGELFYELDFPAHFQGILDGDFPPKIVLTPLSRAQNPNRSALFGTKNSMDNVSLRLAYTEL